MGKEVAVRKREPEMCSQWWALPWGSCFSWLHPFLTFMRTEVTAFHWLWARPHNLLWTRRWLWTGTEQTLENVHIWSYLL